MPLRRSGTPASVESKGDMGRGTSCCSRRAAAAELELDERSQLMTNEEGEEIA